MTVVVSPALCVRITVELGGTSRLSNPSGPEPPPPPPSVLAAGSVLAPGSMLAPPSLEGLADADPPQAASTKAKPAMRARMVAWRVNLVTIATP
jgi:hypothetical protein